MNSEEFKKELFSWSDGIESDKKIWLNKIYEQVDSGTLPKLDAIRLIRRYSLLDVACFIELPDFADSYVSRVEKYQTIYYDELFDDESDFKIEGKVADYCAYFPHITIEDAIDETYDFIKTNEIIGCVYDW